MELDDCQKKMVFLEEQLRVAQRQTDRAMLLKLKKVSAGNGRREKVAQIVSSMHL